MEKTWDGDEELKDLVLHYTEATFNGFRTNFFVRSIKCSCSLNLRLPRKVKTRRLHLLDRGGLEASVIYVTSLPPEFLVVADIKKWSQASGKERKNKNIVLPMCTFMCDTIFEQGWIGVEDGNVVPIRRDGTGRVVNRISPLLGKRVHSWHGPAHVYFRWYANHHWRTIVK